MSRASTMQIPDPGFSKIHSCLPAGPQVRICGFGRGTVPRGSNAGLFFLGAGQWQSQMLQHIKYLGRRCFYILSRLFSVASVRHHRRDAFIPCASLLLQSSFKALPCRICSAPSPRCIHTLAVVASTFIQGSSVSHLFGTIAAMHLIHIHYMLKQIGMHPLVSYARP
jgi:hypothetical protein